MQLKRLMGVALLACSAGVAAGHGESGDVLIGAESGKVTIGRVSEDGLTVVSGERYFFAELGLDVPNEIDEPGFQSIDGLAGVPTFSFSFTRALRAWNGTDFLGISPVSMRTQFGPQSATTPASDVLTPGLTFANSPSGAHDHPTWILNAPASNGVYLLSLSFEAAGLIASDEVWIVFGQNADEATFDAAVEWAEANVPTPASALLLGGGVMMFGRRRR